MAIAIANTETPTSEMPSPYGIVSVMMSTMMAMPSDWFSAINPFGRCCFNILCASCSWLVR